MSAVRRVFADRRAQRLPRIDFAVCADATGPLRTDLGWRVDVEQGPASLIRADLVMVLPTEKRPLTLDPAAAEAIRKAYERGAVVAAFGAGSVLLARTGLLDGRRATTHPDLAARLARDHPSVTVEPRARYVDAGQVVTAGGTAAGIDMCLHLLRREHGAAVSQAVAVDLLPDAPCAWSWAQEGDLAELLAWALDRLDQSLSVDDMARHALMSSRTFARWFREAAGTTPMAWLREQRLDRAEELLRTTGKPVSAIAREVGFQPGQLRRHFTRRHGVPPAAFRRCR
ncbi:helix-turn-helix domain-containing protein [Spirillospora sp. NPDC049024]